MALTLSREIEDRIEQLVVSGQFPDASAAIRSALDALVELEDVRFQRARELVAAGFASGPGVELTDDVWDEIERESEEAFLRGEKPGAHVRP